MFSTKIVDVWIYKLILFIRTYKYLLKLHLLKKPGNHMKCMKYSSNCQSQIKKEKHLCSPNRFYNSTYIATDYRICQNNKSVIENEKKSGRYLSPFWNYFGWESFQIEYHPCQRYPCPFWRSEQSTRKVTLGHFSFNIKSGQLVARILIVWHTHNFPQKICKYVIVK